MRCCWANCSKAAWEGSFNERKPSTELDFFFFLDDDLESFPEELLECREARLDDVTRAILEEEWVANGGWLMSGSRAAGGS